jgi:alcohol dehydrogenase
MKRPLPSVAEGRILGHEGIGVIEQVGTGVSEFHIGDRVIISVDRNKGLTGDTGP